ncbi:MAG: cytochrome c [Spongiibacteraceae bacterium]
MNFRKIVIGCCALLAVQGAIAQTKPDDRIKVRQAAFTVIAANIGKIKTNLDGEYNKDDVLKSIAVIQSLAHTNVASWFPAGTDKGIGIRETQVRTELFDPANAKKIDEASRNFDEQANQFAIVAELGAKNAVQAQFGKLRATCQGCHDNFRVDSTTAAAPAK